MPEFTTPDGRSWKTETVTRTFTLLWIDNHDGDGLCPVRDYDGRRVEYPCEEAAREVAEHWRPAPTWTQLKAMTDEQLVFQHDALAVVNEKRRKRWGWWPG